MKNANSLRNAKNLYRKKSPFDDYYDFIDFDEYDGSEAIKPLF